MVARVTSDPWFLSWTIERKTTCPRLKTPTRAMTTAIMVSIRLTPRSSLLLRSLRLRSGPLAVSSKWVHILMGSLLRPVPVSRRVQGFAFRRNAAVPQSRDALPGLPRRACLAPQVLGHVSADGDRDGIRHGVRIRDVKDRAAVSQGTPRVVHWSSPRIKVNVERVRAGAGIPLDRARIGGDPGRATTRIFIIRSHVLRPPLDLGSRAGHVSSGAVRVLSTGRQ